MSNTTRKTRSSAKRREGLQTAKNAAGYFLICAGPLLFVLLCLNGRAGIFGNACADLALSLFGLGAFCVCCGMTYYGLSVFRYGSKGFEQRRLWGAALALVAAEALCALILPDRGGAAGGALARLLRTCFGVFSYLIGLLLLAWAVFILTEQKPSAVFRLVRNSILEKLERGRAKEANRQQRGASPGQGRTRGKEKEPDTEPGILQTIGPAQTAHTEEPEQTILSLGTVKDQTRGDWVLPPTDLLRATPAITGNTPEETEQNKEIIQTTLGEFGVEAYVVEIASGPTVSRYEVQLAQGIKVSKIVGLADNLAMNLAALNVRIEAPIPGKSAIGVEVPNRERSAVGLREILETDLFQKTKYRLPFVLGADVAGTPRIADLVKMPHLLIAGATGSGKSVGLNALITSLLYRLPPEELRLVLIDPKRVELSLYDGIPHLAHPVVKDVKLAAGVLEAVVKEMSRRYRVPEQCHSRNIESFNDKPGNEKMPYMVVVIDELADMMMQCAKNVEYSICRLAQLSRAVGIHLVVATQRPSVDVITGKIKANIPARIAFTVSSYIDSKTILDTKGAESLIGRGDMLFAPTDEPKPVRIQGCYLSEDDTIRLCDYLKEQREPSYELEADPVADSGSRDGDEGESGSTDDLWDDALRFVVSNRFCSISIMQRRFSIGYNRAARMVDQMEEAGIVGPANGSNRRQVLITEAQLEEYLSGKGEQD